MTEAIILKKVYVYIVFTLKVKIWNHNKYDAYKRFVFVSQKKKTIQTNKLSSNYIIEDIGGLHKRYELHTVLSRSNSCLHIVRLLHSLSYMLQ